jgi:hypothetical protein
VHFVQLRAYRKEFRKKESALRLKNPGISLLPGSDASNSYRHFQRTTLGDRSEHTGNLLFFNRFASAIPSQAILGLIGKSRSRKLAPQWLVSLQGRPSSGTIPWKLRGGPREGQRNPELSASNGDHL